MAAGEQSGDGLDRPPYPSDKVLLEAGKACFDYVVDCNGCHFCNLDAVDSTGEDTHEGWCPLSDETAKKLDGGL